MVEVAVVVVVTTMMMSMTTTSTSSTALSKCAGSRQFCYLQSISCRLLHIGLYSEPSSRQGDLAFASYLTPSMPPTAAKQGSFYYYYCLFSPALTWSVRSVNHPSMPIVHQVSLITTSLSSDGLTLLQCPYVGLPIP